MYHSDARTNACLDVTCHPLFWQNDRKVDTFYNNERKLSRLDFKFAKSTEATVLCLLSINLPSKPLSLIFLSVWTSCLFKIVPPRWITHRNEDPLGTSVALFSPRLRGFWEHVRLCIPRLHFFFKMETRSHTLIPLFMQGSFHSGSASWDDWALMFPDELRVSSFPGKFPHYAWRV